MTVCKELWIGTYVMPKTGTWHELLSSIVLQPLDPKISTPQNSVNIRDINLVTATLTHPLKQSSRPDSNHNPSEMHLEQSAFQPLSLLFMKIDWLLTLG